MINTDLSPVQRIRRRTETGNIESNALFPLMIFEDLTQHNPRAVASQCGSISTYSSKLSLFPTAPLPQSNPPITVPVKTPAGNSSQRTSIIIVQLWWVHRTTLEAKYPLQNFDLFLSFLVSPVWGFQSTDHPFLCTKRPFPRGRPLEVVTSGNWRVRIALDPNLLRIDLRLGKNKDRAQE